MAVVLWLSAVVGALVAVAAALARACVPSRLLQHSTRAELLTPAAPGGRALSDVDHLPICNQKDKRLERDRRLRAGESSTTAFASCFHCLRGDDTTFAVCATCLVGD